MNEKLVNNAIGIEYDLNWNNQVIDIFKTMFVVIIV